jgi:streptogramin lyase
VATIPQERQLIPRLHRPASPTGALRLLAVAAALLLGLAAVGVVMTGGRRLAVVPPTTSPSAAASTSAGPTATPNPFPELVRRIPLDADTWQVVATATRVWVQTGDLGMTGIDSATGEVVAEVSGVAWMLLEGDDLWVQDTEEEVLLRLDPTTGAERERFEDIAGTYFAKDGDTIWTPGEGSVVIRQDLATGRDVASIPVPEGPKQVAIAAGSVWVICDDAGLLARIDPETNEVVDTTEVGRGPVEVKVGFGSLWVRNRDFELVRVDPETGEILSRLGGFDESPSNALSFGDDVVWSSVVTTPAGVAAVDPTTNEIVRQIRLPGGMFMDSTLLGDTLWVTTAFGRELLEVDVGSP